MPLKHNRKHSCWDNSKLHHSFGDSEQTCLCQMCHSEWAGFKAWQKEVSALWLSFTHFVIFCFPSLFLSLYSHCFISLSFLCFLCSPLLPLLALTQYVCVFARVCPFVSLGNSSFYKTSKVEKQRILTVIFLTPAHFFACAHMYSSF